MTEFPFPLQALLDGGTFVNDHWKATVTTSTATNDQQVYFSFLADPRYALAVIPLKGFDTVELYPTEGFARYAKETLGVDVGSGGYYPFPREGTERLIFRMLRQPPVLSAPVSSPTPGPYNGERILLTSPPLRSVEAARLWVLGLRLAKLHTARLVGKTLGDRWVYSVSNQEALWIETYFKKEGSLEKYIKLTISDTLEEIG